MSAIFKTLLSNILLVLAVSNTGFAQRSLQQWEDRVMINLAETRTPQQTGFMMFLSSTNQYVDYGIPAGLLVGGLISNDRAMRENALYIASSTAVTAGVNALLKLIVKRPRPFVQNIKIVPIYRAGEYSFPSGHASTSISTATSLSIAYPKWYVIAPAFLWAGSVSYSRMYLGVHYPTDVAGGTALGVGSAVSLSFLKANP